MTRKETGLIMDRLNRLYMLQMKRLTNDDKHLMLNTWAEVFKDTPYQTVLTAVGVYANKGKAFLPGPPDIIAEILRLEEKEDYKIFDQLVNATNAAAGETKRVVIVDPGGLWYEEEYDRVVYHHPECVWSTNYTAADFSQLPVLIQMYAEDIDGLKALGKEIQSDPVKARRRFMDALPYLRAKIQEVS